MTKCSTGKRCLVCGRHRNTGFKTHIKASMADRTFVCRYCCKTFRQKDEFNQHQRIHTGARLYKCDDCAHLHQVLILGDIEQLILVILEFIRKL